MQVCNECLRGRGSLRYSVGMTDNIARLRAALEARQLQGFILPVNDEFMGEYVPACARRLEWLTGFTGSAGLVVVLQDKAAFFTDGRYTLQAETEVKGCERYNSADLSPEAWIADNAPKGIKIGYDPKLHTLKTVERYHQKAPGVTMVPVQANPVDGIWENRPPAPAGIVQIHPLKFAGEDAAGKRRRMAEEVARAHADAALLTAPDSICWLLNIRGDDVPYTPFVLCYALLGKDFDTVILFLDPARVTPELQAHLGDAVKVMHPDHIAQELARFRGGRVLFDSASSPVWFHQRLREAGATLVEGQDPCQLAKACKNPVELDGTRAAHQRDGLAVTKFLYWLEHALHHGEPLNECSVAQKLEHFRREQPLFREPSFATIAGSGPNGAIVHYHAHEESCRPLDENTLLLLDSGGQYPDGTTDITRTLALGTPTAEMRDRFTRVLKGHIALATAIFPEGTSGSQLDVLARQFLWAEGLDYDHGTGHGVGSYLSVHEGPQRIGKRAGDAVLRPGMILSNEPGYYKTGEYGIRIESLVVVVPYGENSGKQYFAFETLTLAPIDMRLVEDALLTDAERAWLAGYHKRVLKTHAPDLSAQELHWLTHYCNLKAA